MRDARVSTQVWRRALSADAHRWVVEIFLCFWTGVSTWMWSQRQSRSPQWWRRRRFSSAVCGEKIKKEKWKRATAFTHNKQTGKYFALDSQKLSKSGRFQPHCSQHCDGSKYSQKKRTREVCDSILTHTHSTHRCVKLYYRLSWARLTPACKVLLSFPTLCTPRGEPCSRGRSFLFKKGRLQLVFVLNYDKQANMNQWIFALHCSLKVKCNSIELV